MWTTFLEPQLHFVLWKLTEGSLGSAQAEDNVKADLFS
ncbi:hypothetical protein M758_UG213600 [Ceratodon purpureus]|nr:hypothetical protein M758_UG213600 [Ceratodon purpureus]